MDSLMDIEDEMVDYNLAIQANHIECLLHEIDELRRDFVFDLDAKGTRMRSCAKTPVCRTACSRPVRSSRSCSA